MTSTDVDPLVTRMRPFGTTIFAEMSALAVRTGAVNLGQGFPDTDGPPEMLASAAEALRSGHNQYPPGPGIPALRAAVAAHQRRFWGLEYDPDGEVVVTAGATEAVAAAILALCEPGDEVVCFEPYYDSYAASIALAGAVRRPVTLRPGQDGRYAFDPAALRAAFGPRTRLVLLNSPHNPTGKVFTPAELSLIAELCQEHGTYAVTDEVYEHLAFTDATSGHVPLATLPGMWERTLRISSAGKTFSCTGWKVGWASGPAALVSAVLRVKQFLTFVNAAPLQPAVAVALALPDSYFTDFRAGLQARRDQLVGGLTDAGFDVLAPEGTYFVTADITALGGHDGVEFCRTLPERCGVVAVPTQVFYDDPEAGRRLIRFAFCKRPEVLTEAVSRLRRAQPGR
ncbi:N-succinyldiaminopimelate aminotransferase [Micromonospora phaseoli]|uniref:N-succinyldiaminopimelate aminotransferase n=1 Tax=Micromonospora phaseoli TaxID=1144548 RepID=A0A1H6X550_9ACTN|nr:pyridoxal phosphate-dependent aminotransferase [Micromonospora phaseoli]PZW02032.1 succinyldiaminopimelate aminotransferase [Micromonospora phaseoli]GIJ80128.1 aminotransferase [Micromonospora phaseoli]SEJ22614.1 N-succinyldiaminopimelate aminotransferase [Micromonospora phaseoli]